MHHAEQISEARVRKNQIIAANPGLDPRIIARRLAAEFDVCVYLSGRTMYGSYWTQSMDGNIFERRARIGRVS